MAWGLVNYRIGAFDKLIRHILMKKIVPNGKHCRLACFQGDVETSWIDNDYSIKPFLIVSKDMIPLSRLPFNSKPMGQTCRPAVIATGTTGGAAINQGKSFVPVSPIIHNPLLST
jgi:hypothetical protein